MAYLLGVIESEDRIPDRDDEGMDEDWPGIHGMSRPGMDAHGRDADAAAATPASSGTESAAASLALDAGASLMLDPLRSPSSQPDPACFMYRVDWRDLVGLLHSLIDSHSPLTSTFVTWRSDWLPTPYPVLPVYIKYCRDV